MRKIIPNPRAEERSASGGAGGFRLLRRYMPELDVFRGAAILMVVLYHGFYWTERAHYRLAWETFFVNATVGGWLGVNLFFILSGFLITGILLDARPRPAYYRTFYTKRALRILPALAATLAFAVLLHLTSVAGTLLSVAFMVNYAPALGVTDFYVPLWSLAVEEHFYLLWPTVVHRFKTATVTAIAIGLCVVEPVLRALSGRFHLGDPHEHTHLIADYLATGALLAVFARSRFASRTNSITLAFALILLGAAILVVGVPHRILHRDNALGDALQVVPFNLLFAGALLLALALQWKVFSGPLLSPMRYLGYISYGLYLYHLLVLGITATILHRLNLLQATADFATLASRFLIMFVAAVAVSDISRRWLEQPFLGLKACLTGEASGAPSSRQQDRVQRGGANA